MKPAARLVQSCLLLIAFAFAAATFACAADRNCTGPEKKRADGRLAEIGADSAMRNKLLRYHLRFGRHESETSSQNEEIFVQGGYVMNHDSDLRTALWVSYRLTVKNVIDAQGKDRVNCFRQDPRRGSFYTAVVSDYDEPRFDQGHMANDADMKYDAVEQINTYIMSNMSPQECRFNRGIWLSLEHLTRAWAEEYDTIYVTSGAIFDRDNDGRRDPDAEAVRMKSRNGKARVAVPSHYYKVFVRREDGGGFRSIAFLLPHDNARHGATWGDVRPHVLASITSIAEIERRAGVHLHPRLSRGNLAESTGGEDWDFANGKPNLEKGCPG
jgi:endonuclease G